MIPNGTRVGTYLLWLVLAVSVPLLMFTAGTVWRFQHAEQQQQEFVLADLARDASQPVDRAFEHLENGLLSLAGSSALDRGDLDGFGREMRLLSVRLGDVPVTLTVPDGGVLLRVGGSQPASPAESGTVRQAALAVLRADAPVVTNLLAANNPADREVAVAVPVLRAGNTDRPYVLIGEFGGARLAALAEVPVPNSDGLMLTIRDRDGVTVARSLQSDRHIGEPAQPGFQKAIAGGRSGLLPDAATPEDGSAIRAFSVAPVSGYSVVAALPRSAFGASIRRDLLGIALIGVALLIVGLLAAALLGRRLVGALRAVEHGGPAIVPSGLREVDELAARLRAVSNAREASENTLRDSEGRLRDLVGTLDLAAIMTREVNGTIRFWSQGCVALYGWSREEAVGRSSHELLRTQFPVPLRQIQQNLLSRGEWKGDLIQRRRNGTLIVVATHKALKRQPDGRPQMVMMESLVDVTALREAQDALWVLNHGLEERVRTEVSAREAVQRRASHADRIQALGQLAGGIAHDFNNVLQAVAGGAALIGRRPEDVAAVGRLVRIISEAAARGASITRRMLVLARRSDLKAEPVEPDALLAGMREVFIFTLGAEIVIEVEVAPGLPWLVADKAQLETALVNLGTNARDAMPDGGTLRLTAGLEIVEALTKPRPAGLAPGMYVRLSVIDDGTGMTNATLVRVGEPFFTTKDVGKGTGLGLSMVKGFAEQSGGGFVIESVVGTGTRATLWLPAAPADMRLRPGGPAGDVQSRLTGRILLVDDDQLVRDMLREQLESLGHKVLAACDGSDALVILRAREAVDLMITDLSMPGMSGLTLIKEAQGLRPSLPAILLTGYAGDAASLETGSLAKGAYFLMRKPASSELLNARVTAMLERS
jgi:PAS domain S-box-containing protein